MNNEADLHDTFTITQIRDESRDVKTLSLEPLNSDLDYEASPGQFVMAWIPGVSENPFSVAGMHPLRLTVKNRGDFTEALFRKGGGDKVFIRGPYGNHFTSFIDMCNWDYDIYYIAGGYGAVPLLHLARWYGGLRDKKGISALLGAKTREDVILNEAFSEFSGDVRIATEDGSYGRKGLVTDLMEEIPEESYLFACGPDRMLLAVAEKASESLPEKNIVLSAERYMKCGQGICRCCEIKDSDGNGLSVCQDGPVFTYSQLRGGDLGKYHREKSGLKKPI